MRDSGPGLKSEKSGTLDWDGDSSKYPGLEAGLYIFLYNTKPGLKSAKSGTRDWDGDSSIYPGLEAGLYSFLYDTKPGLARSPKNQGLGQDRDSKSENPGSRIETRNYKNRDPGLGPGQRFVGCELPRLNYSGLSRGLKIFRDTAPVLCRPLVTNWLPNYFYTL